MARGNLAAYDPIFWCHHSFLDYIWELFRRRIQNAPADYPFGYHIHHMDQMILCDLIIIDIDQIHQYQTKLEIVTDMLDFGNMLLLQVEPMIA